ncbi:alpha-galactosidase [Georgenia sp. TF02-10]|uniref:glycoside hydrolase family 36 protein n=1 Tax=Georgenia sp. TF02-10 TaxID=2917725 RepID=UPI001FA72637|nr:glycoside hydrolase family 36 protein [Georgenia sp. TF02-10]UNX55688.1 alpha-galactosidase [Georgenia sp. TF02-10]
MTFGPVDAVDVDPDRARVYEEGWQSWSPTGWYPAAQTSPRPRERWQHLMRFRPGSELPPHGFQGSGLLVVDPGTGVPARIYGAETATTEVPTIRAELRGSRLVVSSDGPVLTDEAADGAAGLAGFGDRFAAAAGVGALRPAPTVWCSWYRYFLDVTEADIMENVRAVVEQELPVDVIQVDDGWQAGIGDWTTLSGRFASLDGLAARIRDAGLRAGIWLAPFTVGSASRLARDHPDWLVGDGGTNWGQQLAGLDLTHPGARAYLTEVFTTLREAGFSYYKLDFLYAGAVPGDRHAPVSPVEAYRSGLELVRGAVGPDAYLVGCGAPILPSVGLVDAMRVSPDTFHPEGQDGSRGLRGAPGARARAWQHGRLWVNDPDCLVARPSFAPRAEWAAVVERYGGLRSCSDRIAELDDWGLSATRRLLASAPPPRPF